MRKIALVMLFLLIAPWASAQTLPMAAAIDMQVPFERYASFVLDEQTGEWSAHGLVAAQLLSTVAQGQGSSAMEGGLLALYPGVRGNVELSLMEPVLYVCLVRYSPIAGQAVSIATGGHRYDFVGKAQKAKIGPYNCETFALPLGEQGLALLKSLGDEGGEVRVAGEARTFRTAIRQAETYGSAKARVEAMAQGAARDFLAQWPAGYALWDLNQAHWSEERPQMAALALDERPYDALPALEAGTQLLDTAKGSAVKAYQQLLKDAAFFTAKPDGTFGKATRVATKQAQQYYGLPATGLPDRRLIECLAGGAAPQHPEQGQMGGVDFSVDGLLSLRLDRAWAARFVAPQRATSAMDWVAPADRSNYLLAADGEAANHSQTAQSAMILQAWVETGQGARYACAIQLEKDEGRAFDGALLPQDRRRLVILCELPASVDISGCVLTLQAQGGQSLQIGLEPWLGC